MKVKYLDLKAQYLSMKDEIDTALQNVVDNTAFILGNAVGEFECDFSAYCGVKYAAGVNSGTSACLLALKAAGVETDDEVIVPAHTFIATLSAVALSGAKPVLVDVDPETRNIDPHLLEKAITKKTKVLMPVHLYGRMVDLEPIVKMADHYGLDLIEDAAQAHGAELNGKKAGSIGKAAAFSFYPGKNLGAYGEGGAVVTDLEEVDRQVRMLRDHGSPKKYYHERVGYNARMEGFQGAVLNVKLKYLDQWNDARRSVAKKYNQGLAGLPIKTPSIPEGRQHVFHCYVIESERRDELQAHLTDHGVPTIIHYPVPNHLQRAYSYLGYRAGDFPVTERLSQQVLSLPIYPELSDDHVDYVCDTIRDFYSG